MTYVEHTKYSQKKKKKKPNIHIYIYILFIYVFVICICSMDPCGKTIKNSSVGADMQFTLLSDTEKFCSFYPVSGNAIGLKFENANDMKSTQALISQILNPEKKPKDIKEPEVTAEKKPLACLNFVRTQKDSSVRRGAVVKALAICTRLQILESFKPLLITALDNYFVNESETGLSFLYVTLNEAEFDPNVERGPTRQISLYLQGPSDTDETYSVPVVFHGITMPLTVPYDVGPDEITGVSVVNFFNIFRKHLSLIYNAVFTQKRILYLGHHQPAETVCQMVLATCLLVSPAIEGTLKRAYPYACLTAMQFLQVLSTI
ncbi:hypothetical protein RFI_13043 [Reticulomyxa filosa]|uniref:UDENN domain-containing protein n=1 Tax=Reticulomyxa filosa TaxID=46433 RepID=X6NCR9_RETFI|nr:hypothetical protein RFI_13043 [Reticulomyxa filosa]|eukprot:ETO24115.1 hypothetical protein RFI_13043 [Reticulomyxa filosa]